MVSKAGIIVPQICLRNLDSDEEKELPFGITRNALVLKDLEYSPNGKYLFVSGRNPIIDDTGSEVCCLGLRRLEMGSRSDPILQSTESLEFFR